MNFFYRWEITNKKNERIKMTRYFNLLFSSNEQTLMFLPTSTSNFFLNSPIGQLPIQLLSPLVLLSTNSIIYTTLRMIVNTFLKEVPGRS